MEDDAAEQLDRIVLHAEDAARSLADRRKSLRKDVVQSLSLCQTCAEFLRLRTQFFIRFCLHLRAERLDRIDLRPQQLYFSLTVCAEQFFN